MINNIDVKVDKAGRIIIPKKVRDYFNIKKDDRLLLTINKNGIFLKKDNFNEEYLKVINKISFLEKQFNISYIIVKDNTIMTANEMYKKHIGEKTNFSSNSTDELNFINKLVLNNNLTINNAYCCSIFVNYYTIVYTFIIINDIEQNKLLKSYLEVIF